MLASSVSVMMLAASLSHAQPSSPGTAYASASVHWDQVPLGDAVSRVVSTFQWHVWVDRRIDPNERIVLSVKDASAMEILAQLAAMQSLGVSQLEEVTYLGPRPAAERLRTLAELRRDEVTRLPAIQRRAWQQPRPTNWQRLAEPRALVGTLVDDVGWSLAGADLIAHDLWLAGQLPPLALADCLTLLLSGFDLTFQLNPADRTVEILPITQPVRLIRRYAWPTDAGLTAQQLRRRLPNVSIDIKGQHFSVDGRLEDHERVLSVLSGRDDNQTDATANQGTKQVFTLRVTDQPVGAVVNHLQRQLEWDIEIDQAAQPLLQRRVSFTVDAADQNELLEALLNPAGLKFERTGEKLLISPR